ncbi:MAG: SAM-dependent methyltransferase, partial [Blastocatellia bacterium]
MTILKEKLISALSAGPITFRDFMDRALYDPEHGYYNTSRLKIGPEGDYYTSSNVHPSFGATLAGAFVKLW